MKKLIALVPFAFIVFSLSTNGQSIDSLGTSKSIFKKFSLNLKKAKNPLANNLLILPQKSTSFSIYNAATGQNDFYFLNENEYSYSESKTLFENSFRGQKINSLNPYGSSNIETTLLLGVVNYFLK